MIEIDLQDLTTATGGLLRSPGKALAILLPTVAAGTAALLGAKHWCYEQDRSGTLKGQAFCSGFYERQGKPHP